MSRSVQPLVLGRVIVEVLDMFSPSVDLAVRYGSKKIANGCEIKPSATTDKPSVQINHSPPSKNLYTLVMVDPDEPNPNEPTMREWLLWVVINIPEGSDAATKGKEVVPYMRAQPKIGIHRYVFVLFRQSPVVGSLGTGRDQPPYVRANFRTRNFAAQNKLGLPVAAVYFNAQREPVGKKH